MLNRSRLLGLLLAALAASLLIVAGVALAALPPGGTFTDDNGNIHEGNIEAIAAEGITRGCNPPANTLYCPSSTVTRGQMAAFIRRAFSLPSSGTDFFSDDDDSVFEGDINAVAEAGITKGCNPPTNDRFCPDGKVTREQMAAFLRRAFEYPATSTDYFTDDDTSIFEADINAIAKAGVTLGCNPPTNSRYCPAALVKRDQMASFFSRALGLTPIVPPPPTTVPPDTSVTMTHDPFQDRWHGWASTEPVDMSWSNPLYGWTGHVGSDSVLLLRSESGDWSGCVGSDAVVLYGSTIVGEWTGFIGSEPISLTGGVYHDGVEGSIGSAPVLLTYDEVIENVRGTGPRTIGVLIPILFDEFNWH